MSYSDDIQQITALRQQADGRWNAINPEYAARMRVQNQFQNGLEIASTSWRSCVKIWLSTMQILHNSPSH